MARTKMNLSGEIRISDYLSLGMLANIIPLDVVKSTLMSAASKQSGNENCHVSLSCIL